MTNELANKFNKALRASTPLISINCFDPEATIQNLTENIYDDKFGIIQWDCVKGWQARNNEGLVAIGQAVRENPIEATVNPVESLMMAGNLPENTILFLLNGHLFFKDNPSFMQAFWNLRDSGKAIKRSIVILSNSFVVPSEIQQDVLILNEKLPDEKELENIIKSLTEDPDSGMASKISKDEMAKAVEALKGLSAFPAEQSVALSIKKSGLDIDELWTRKIQLINDTIGLTVWKDGHKFDDLGGLFEIKSRFKRIMNGRKPPTVIVWIDEIEKAMAGAGGDSSGTSQDQLGVLLSEMQEKDYSGSLFVGVSGAAKSALVKAIGNEANILIIKLDLGEMKGQFVGLSEERIRTAMKIIEAVGGIGGAFFIATSNDVRAIKPELKRRFSKGIWFFDLPTAEERKTIWDIYLKKYELPLTHKVQDQDWTGAEIENCCKIAWEEMISVEEASKSIIPVAVSGKEQILMLQTEANGKYASTNYAGVYNSSLKDVKKINNIRSLN